MSSMWLQVENTDEKDTDIYFGVFNSDPRSIGKMLKRPSNPCFGYQLSAFHASSSDEDFDLSSSNSEEIECSPFFF